MDVLFQAFVIWTVCLLNCYCLPVGGNMAVSSDSYSDMPDPEAYPDTFLPTATDMYSDALQEAINSLPNPPRDRPLSALTLDDVTESIAYVIEKVLEELAPPACEEVIVAELFLGALKKRTEMELFSNRTGSLHNVVMKWFKTNNIVGLQESVEAIVSTIYAPVLDRIEKLQKQYGVLWNSDQFIDSVSIPAMFGDAASMPLSVALNSLFAPAEMLKVEPSTRCRTMHVITDLFKMATDISNYLQDYLATNFVMLVSSNEPWLSSELSKKLMEHLVENYSIPASLISVVSPNFVASDEEELRNHCAMALAEFYFDRVLAGQQTAPVQLSDVFDQYYLPDPEITLSYVDQLMNQYHDELTKNGITDLTPMDVLNAFMKTLIEKAEVIGLDETKLNMAIQQTLEKMASYGIPSGSNKNDEAVQLYTMNKLSGLLEIVQQAVDDIARVLLRKDIIATV